MAECVWDVRTQRQYCYKEICGPVREYLWVIKNPMDGVGEPSIGTMFRCDPSPLLDLIHSIFDSILDGTAHRK